MSKKDNETALATVGEKKKGLSLEAIASIYNEDLDEGMDGVVVRLPQYKIIRESGQFLTPEGTCFKDLIGVIVDSHLSFGYWENKDDKRPTCFSFDGKVPSEGVEHPLSPKCISCPMNQFGSAKEGRGKACKNMRRLVILLDGEQFPIRLTLPPTSLKPYDEYVCRLRTKGLPPNAVMTNLSLGMTTTPEGYKVAIASFKTEMTLSPEDYLEYRKLKELVKERRQEAIIEDEYETDESSAVLAEEEASGEYEGRDTPF